MYPSNPYFSHSAKGTTWGKHKYVRKENGRYIYPEDEKRSRKLADSSRDRWNANRNQAAIAIRTNTGVSKVAKNAGSVMSNKQSSATAKYTDGGTKKQTFGDKRFQMAKQKTEQKKAAHKEKMEERAKERAKQREQIRLKKQAKQKKENDKRLKEANEKMKMYKAATNIVKQERISGGYENITNFAGKTTKKETLQQKTGKTASEKKKEIQNRQKKKGQEYMKEYMKKTLKKRVGR